MTQLDHLVVAVPDLASATDSVHAATGVRPEFGGVHAGLGTHNALLSFGDSYLELIAADPQQPDAPRPRPFDVEQFDAPTLVTFAVHPGPGGSMDAVIAAARRAGYDPGDAIAMHRIRPTGERLDWQLTLPPAVGVNLVPFVIDWGATDSPAATAPTGVSLDVFEIRAPDTATRRSLAALDVPTPVVDAAPPGLFARLVGPAGVVEFTS